MMIASTTPRQQQQQRRQQTLREREDARFQAPLADAASGVPAPSLPRLPRGEVTRVRRQPLDGSSRACAHRRAPRSRRPRRADRECDACDEAPRRPTLELAEVIRRFGPEYRRQAGEQLTVQQDRVLRELLVCRTEVLGAHDWMCERCGQEVALFHSCKNRHCPKCGAYERRLWAQQVQADLLPLEYHHAVLTLPQPLTLLAWLIRGCSIRWCCAPGPKPSCDWPAGSSASNWAC